MRGTYSEILHRLDACTKLPDVLVKEVRGAVRLAPVDPRSALVKARGVLEHVARVVFDGRFKEKAGTQPLEAILQKLTREQVFPRSVSACAGFVRDFGNIAAHYLNERLSARNAVDSLSQLLVVLEWYGGGPTVDRAEHPKREVPPLLPHLCDRSGQEHQIVELVQGHADHGRPIVCIVHGDELQCHLQFLERLRAETLRGLLGMTESEGDVPNHVVECPTGFRKPSEFRGRFLSALSRKVLNRPGGALEEVAAELALRRGPVMVTSRLMTDDWGRSGRAPIDDFVRFWAEWPNTGARHVVVAMLVVTYRLGLQEQSRLGRYWLRLSNARLRRYLSRLRLSDIGGIRGKVLDELLGVTRTEAENWALDDRVKEFCGRQPLWEVQQLYSGAQSAIAMGTLAEALEVILGDALGAMEAS